MSRESALINKYERRKTASRERIKASAVKLFSQNGIEGTTVAAIIKEAGIAHKTFFNHFPSKNHLLRGIAEDVTEVAYDIFAEAGSHDLEPYEEIRFSFMKIAKGMSEFAPGQKELVQYCLIGLPVGPNDMRAKQAVKLRSAIGKILREAKNKGQLSKKFSYEVLLDITLGIFTSTLTNWAMEDGFPLVSKARQAVKFIQHTVFEVYE